jgi:hypothetical protein
MDKSLVLAALMMVSLPACASHRDELLAERESLDQELLTLRKTVSRIQFGQMVQEKADELIKQRSPCVQEDDDITHALFQMMKKHERCELNANRARQTEICARLEQIDREIANLR